MSAERKMSPAEQSYWDDLAEARKEAREERGADLEDQVTSDPRSKYGNPADWNYPRGAGYDQ